MSTTLPLAADVTEFIANLRGKLVECFETVFPADLECACAVSSYTLYRALRARGISASFVQGFFEHESEDHCWVRINEHIVDITACQFSRQFPAVFITTVDDSRYSPCRADREALRDINTNWPTEQTPRNHRHRIARVLKTLSP
jgi:hypothetical protein